jgi:hypothetical protein
MPERLELELRALGGELAYPPAPDVSARVGDRLRAEPPPLRGRLVFRRPLVVALAVLAAALVAALAVPPVRAALLDLLGIGGVTIERVEELPEITPGQDLGLGAPVPLGEARRSVDFPVLLPDEDEWGEPDAVFRSSSPAGGMVSLLYGSERRVRLLVTAFRGRTEPSLMKKAAEPSTSIQPLSVRGAPGYFISGAPHAVIFEDANGEIREDAYRLAQDVLLWVENGVTYRLEGDLSRARALEIAESLGPAGTAAP